LHRTTDFDKARDELFAHIHRCDVLQANDEQRAEWMKETVDYLGERYPALAPEQLDELKAIGARFCQPAIPHGRGNTALTLEDETPEEDGADSLVGAA
jgi:hypothetical protein